MRAGRALCVSEALHFLRHKFEAARVTSWDVTEYSEMAGKSEAIWVQDSVAIDEDCVGHQRGRR